MTAWTTISNALVAVGAKPFATTVQAFRDNVIAAFEGDASAIAAGVTLRLAALQRLVAGTTIRLRQDATLSITSATFATVSSYSLIQTGQIRVTFDHRYTGGADASEARIQRTRAGSTTTLVTHNTSSTSFQSRTLDVDVIPGDVVTVQHRVTAGANPGEIRNRRLSTDAATAPFPLSNFGEWENLP